jgi:hypothetical protein
MDSTTGPGPNGNSAPLDFAHRFGDPPPPPKTARGTLVVLADGHEWRIPAFSFYDLQVHQGVVDAAFANVNWTNDAARAAAVHLIRLAMARNYPGITEDLVVQLLDHEAAADAFKVIWVQNGMKVRDLLARMGLDPPASPTGLAPNPNPSAPTGPESTDG